MEYNSEANKKNPVLVDVWKTNKLISHETQNKNYFYIDGLYTPYNNTNVRPGMLIEGTFQVWMGSPASLVTQTFTSVDELYVRQMEYDNGLQMWKVYIDYRGSNFSLSLPSIFTSLNTPITFISPKRPFHAS